MIAKPGFTPAVIVFRPVWTLLYVFMGTAAFLVRRRFDERSRPIRIALGAFAVQLPLNGLRSPASSGSSTHFWVYS